MEKDLEPTLDMLLAQKVKPQAMRKEPVAKKERNIKFGSIAHVPVARQQLMRAALQFEDYPVDSESTLSEFARQNFGVELGIDSDETKSSASKPSGRGYSF